MTIAPDPPGNIPDDGGVTIPASPPQPEPDEEHNEPEPGHPDILPDDEPDDG